MPYRGLISTLIPISHTHVDGFWPVVWSSLIDAVSTLKPAIFTRLSKEKTQFSWNWTPYFRRGGGLEGFFFQGLHRGWPRGVFSVAIDVQGDVKGLGKKVAYFCIIQICGFFFKNVKLSTQEMFNKKLTFLASGKLIPF